jgi:hypothetical protein
MIPPSDDVQFFSAGVLTGWLSVAVAWSLVTCWQWCAAIGRFFNGLTQVFNNISRELGDCRCQECDNCDTRNFDIEALERCYQQDNEK